MTAPLRRAARRRRPRIARMRVRLAFTRTGREALLALSALAALLASAASPRPAAAQAIDTAAALGALRDFRHACELEGGALWGRSLCGPVALVEPATRLVLSNDTVAGRPFLALGDAWIGVLPAGLPLANYAFRWGERRWAMVLLPFLPEDRHDRVKLLVHESFHREQAELGFPPNDAAGAHLDEEAGRLWLRLELRALAAALESSGRESEEHARDALLFRARRHALFAGADSLESALEMHEGLAEYTGAWAAARLTGASPARVSSALREFEARPSYVRSFAYATTPALGLLLDRHAAGWRDRVATERSLARPLGGALRFRPPAALAREAERRAARYGLTEVRAAEAARGVERLARQAAYRARLVDGPVLLLEQDRLQRTFNPNELVPLGELGTVYPTGTFTAPWGRLEVTDGGALVASDGRRLTLAAPPGGVDGSRIAGDGWTLELAAGWSARPHEGRPGSWQVVAPSAP